MTQTTTLPDRVRGFPFPFAADTYRYSTNIEPARAVRTTEAGGWGATIVDVDGDYRDELAERARILARDPTRCIVLPHMRVAAWDTLLLGLQELALARPGQMRLRRERNGAWHWVNELAEVEQRFVFGDDDTLPCEPLRFVGDQLQEDLVLLDQREQQLFADAGLVTFAADWSLGFDVGMSFLEVHGPVPRIHVEGIIPRAQQFLLRLQLGHPYRRTNWTMTVDRRLDTATETYPEWGPDRSQVVLGDDVGARLHLRVEVQHLVRLAESGAVLFVIRSYLLSLRELALVEPWRRRTAEVLDELPQDLVDYKGITRFRSAAVDWLRAAA
ncbi:DUF3445 domain-containing protein [Conexibacter stalactiti]|uniref:DUF3445 domain-containing protein n=1 Tax=Conexibacter stalactiti TaxID=1940611 RepID=A0ABU4HL98_9ACTN|nr:DUF3445 domain-containing protein [Conexibacter stalactiti]MDW5594077.1 DUF3445 domain-containing protein [Conexibacter stalactiti]MEC5034719.1 DUF3445 domain-containing protein [Conexibacter stalactiti]